MTRPGNHTLYGGCSPQRTTMIYRARYVLPMDDRIIENGEVLVSDGEIRAVGERLVDAHPDEAFTDLGNCALLPGFVNAHSHVEYTSARNAVDALNLWDWIGAVGFNRTRLPDRRTLKPAAAFGAAKLMTSGVTCVGDSSFTGAAADALSELGLRGIVYLEVFGQSAGDNYAQVFDKKLDDAHRLQADCSRLVNVGISPHSIYTSNRGLLKLCAETCAELDIPVAMHLAETQAEVDYSLHGTGPIAAWRGGLGYEAMINGMRPAAYLHAVGLLRRGVCLAHCVHLSAEEVELLASSGAGIAHCSTSNAYLGCGIAPVVDLLQSGARVGIGTDGAASSPRLDFFEEMRFALGIQRARAQDASVLTANDMLKMATVGGARALGLDDYIGTIEPGKRADLIAVDMKDAFESENLCLAVLSRQPSDVRLVLVDGAEVVRDGRPVGADLDALSEALKERLSGG